MSASLESLHTQFACRIDIKPVVSNNSNEAVGLYTAALDSAWR
jgi:hypothetical protein